MEGKKERESEGGVRLCVCVCEREIVRERERRSVRVLKNGTILFKNSKHVSMHSDPEILMYDERPAR